jgi:hypothetical protein
LNKFPCYWHWKFDYKSLFISTYLPHYLCKKQRESYPVLLYTGIDHVKSKVEG